METCFITDRGNSAFLSSVGRVRPLALHSLGDTGAFALLSVKTGSWNKWKDPTL